MNKILTIGVFIVLGLISYQNQTQAVDLEIINGGIKPLNVRLNSPKPVRSVQRSLPAQGGSVSIENFKENESVQVFNTLTHLWQTIPLGSRVYNNIPVTGTFIVTIEPGFIGYSTGINFVRRPAQGSTEPIQKLPQEKLEEGWEGVFPIGRLAGSTKPSEKVPERKLKED
jgi:hypothetical protein